jgi:hypothetical protein
LQYGLVFDNIGKINFMKTTRNILYAFMAICLSFLVISCEPDDPDDDITAARTKFVGTWTCVEASQLTYTVVLSESLTNESEVLLANFHHLGQNEKATGSVAGYTITLPEQFMCNGDYKIKGSGIMTANQKSISFQYIVEAGATVDTINATYTKQ